MFMGIDYWISDMDIYHAFYALVSFLVHGSKTV